MLRVLRAANVASCELRVAMGCELLRAVSVANVVSCCELRVAMGCECCELRVARVGNVTSCCKLRAASVVNVASCELCVASCELCVASCCELRMLRAASCCLILHTHTSLCNPTYRS